jgi:hypothetical protein
MRSTILFFALIVFALQLAAQDQHCATDQVMKTYFEKHPGMKQKLQQEKMAHAQRRANGFQQVNSASYTIPVVFHILHMGGPENISDAQVTDGLRILNRDYAKQNPDTIEIIPSFKPLADSAGIQFALATIDPNGQCTNGIIHHYDTNTDWYDTSSYDYTWDPTRYMNVYLVRTITMGNGFGASGYTYFPGTWTDGDPMDAIVVLNNYFGSIGTSSNFTSRVLTHEVGHWLGLLHVFGFNSAAVDCNNDDFISDTPTTAGFVSCPDAGDPSAYQLCTSGVDENFQNYMDYSYCVRMFTQEQCIEMRNTLESAPGARNNLWTNANLLSTGVLNPMSTCTPIADFNYDRSIVCVGAPVTFSDASQNGTPTSYTWTLTGATPSSSNAAAPSVVYSSPGFYSVTYTSANIAGTSAPITKTNIIQVIPANAQFQNNFSEDFESDVFSMGSWHEHSTSGGSHWIMTTDAAYSGMGSALVPYASNTRNMQTAMESPSINLSTFTNPHLTYKYAGQETNPDHVNSLRVYITTNCGTSWNLIDSLGGMDLATGGIGAQGYIPFDINEWAPRNINLVSFATAPSAYFKFVYTRDTIAAANNFYVDDINITSIVGLKENNTASFRLFPNPTNGEITIDLVEKADLVYITDVTGRIIEEQTVSSMQLHMLRNKPEAGMYFVHVLSGNTQAVRKIVVK